MAMCATARPLLGGWLRKLCKAPALSDGLVGRAPTPGVLVVAAVVGRPELCVHDEAVVHEVVNGGRGGGGGCEGNPAHPGPALVWLLGQVGRAALHAGVLLPGAALRPLCGGRPTCEPGGNTGGSAGIER